METSLATRDLISKYSTATFVNKNGQIRFGERISLRIRRAAAERQDSQAQYLKYDKGASCISATSTAKALLRSTEVEQVI